MSSLSSVIANGATQGLYAYDGLERRVESVEGSSTTFYAYAGTETLAEQTPAGTVTDYVYAGSMRIASVSGSTVNYYHTDALGSTRLVTDASQKIVFSDGYLPYGGNNGSPSGSATYRFTGKPVSQTTGLYYEYQRWYDPSIGRFISPDPRKGHLSYPQTLNLYIYAVDQPTGIIDPTGMDGCGIFSGFCNFVSSGASTVYNGTVSFGNDVVNEWNNDPNFRAGVIFTLGTIAIVATAGIAAPAVLPAIAVGIGLGAGLSTAGYVGVTLATGGQVAASGLFVSASAGAFFGAATAGLGSAFSGAGSAASASSSLESVADSEAEQGLDLSSHFLAEDHLSQIASKFTGYSGNTGDAMSLISDTLDTGNVNLAESSGNPLRIAFEQVLPSRSGPYGLRAVWDFELNQLWTAYPFPVVD